MKKQIDLGHIINEERFNRRRFLKATGVAGAAIALGRPDLWADDKQSADVKTNIADVLNIPKGKYALPGPFPGKVVEVYDADVLINEEIKREKVAGMFETGMKQLTGTDMREAFRMFFTKDDVIGIKVNPVGPGLINTRLELVDSIIEWLNSNGIPREQIVIWDRFDYMLRDAGYTEKRFPGVRIAGLQTMDEAAIMGEHDDSRWLDSNGNHISLQNFDKKIYYWADVKGPDDKAYLNQHVVNSEYSYFGRLITQELTKIINVPVFKNTGNGISMATKNIGYGAICNTGRLHRPLFFNVCTEVLAFPAIRDKMVLNITDGIRAQYDGGPMPAPEFAWEYKRIFFATDPFALDSVCHNLMVEKRKSMNVNVNEHPRFTEYLRYAEKLGLGIADAEKITHIIV